jgi:hypothetical protein
MALVISCYIYMNYTVFQHDISLVSYIHIGIRDYDMSIPAYDINVMYDGRLHTKSCAVL